VFFEGPERNRRLSTQHGASYRTTLHNGVITYVKDSEKGPPVSITLTGFSPGGGPDALAPGQNLDAEPRPGSPPSGRREPARRLFSVLQPGYPGFNIVEP